MTKGEKTKQRIMLSAKMLFAKKGYLAVTMKDICEAAEISRGGLYAHFSSTGEILGYIIELEQQTAHKAFDDAICRGVPPYTIIRHFLSTRIDDICNPETSLSGALNEFAKNSETGKLLVKKRASDAVEILTQMIDLGQQQGSFRPVDAKKYALSLLWLLEGMNAHAELFEMNKEFAEEQLFLALDMLKKS